MNRNFHIFFDNGGGITLLLADYCRHYDRADWAANDVRALLGGADPSDWDNNEPEFRRDPHPEDDIMTAEMAASILAGNEYPERGAAWKEFCELLAGFSPRLRIEAQERGAEYGRRQRELADEDIAEGRRATRPKWTNGAYEGWLPRTARCALRYEAVLDAAARAAYEA
jgi:hypothetical protein